MFLFKFGILIDEITKCVKYEKMISKSAYHDEKGDLVREFATTKKEECYNEIKTKGKCSEEKKKLHCES